LSVKHAVSIAAVLGNLTSAVAAPGIVQICRSFSLKARKQHSKGEKK